jgi:serine protease Do
MGPDLTRESSALERELERIAEQLRQLTVRVHGRRRGGGSGVIWRSTGLIITNAHVARAPSATVTLADGRTFEATVTAIDLQRDLAALELRAGGLPCARIGDSNAVRVGELAFAVGNPLGIVGALTAGIIHALGPPDEADRRGWIRADIRLAPGNSGGPLADAQGRIIGINSMVAGGIAFAVPSNAVERFLNGDDQQPMLGVTLRSIPLPGQSERILGLLVLGVAPRSAAEAAGIMLGDVLIGVNGQRFASPHDLSRALRHIGVGGRLAIDLIRGGQLAVCEVVVSASRSGLEVA